MLGALTLLKLTKEDTPIDNCRFQRLMVSFNLSVDFKDVCRPFIRLDSFHLKGLFERNYCQ